MLETGGRIDYKGSVYENLGWGGVGWAAVLRFGCDREYICQKSVEQ